MVEPTRILISMCVGLVVMLYAISAGGHYFGRRLENWFEDWRLVPPLIIALLAGVLGTLFLGGVITYNILGVLFP